MHITDGRTREIIKKWYYALGFDKRYDEEFLKALDTVYVDGSAISEDYNTDDADGKKNLLYYLYFCEEMQRAYLEKGIPQDMFLDNVYDIVTWTDIWSDLKGELFLGEIDWLWCIFTLRIIKVGRLQYFRRGAREDVPQKNIKKGDPVLDVHIPARGPLHREECVKSFELAREFFARFYPEFDYKCFTCHSWLLDPTIDDILGPESNIHKFRELFDVVATSPSRGIYSYVLRWKITDEEIPFAECKSSLAKRVKAEWRTGRQFYAGYGIINR